MSFFTSLSGLKGAQSDLAVISNNVANVASIGFKKSRAEFGDLISASPLQSGNIAGQGTRLKSISQQFTQGGFQTSDRALDLAISGQGFFVTKTGAQLSFTRNGAFSIDESRYLVDSNGAYVQVLPVDTSGAVTATGISSSQNLQVPLSAGRPKATTTLDLSATFPSDSDLPASRSAYNATFPYKFDRYDPQSYNYSSATTVYDSAGNPQQATLYYTRVTAPTATDTTSKWEARLFIGDQQASADGSAVTDPPAPLELTFAADGSLTSPTSAQQFSSVLPSGASEPIGINLSYGTTTRQAASTFTPGAFRQDGKAAGQLNNVSVGTDGLISATFSDGTTTKLGKIMIANFANPNGLRQLGDARWGSTGLSGDAIVSEAGSGSAGLIQSGALEQANVDITEELVALISAQRDFSANAKAIETGNNMTQTIINLRT
ncbi:flagellar hook protein FlgE [Sphingomonas sp. BIUV-7]|uniref:Flagellar hook protein FlgE n=1 Tax=Sphingomonas natans TaxID=3063330 RepID=A0ABT8YDX6_9SPHN|nr:flagellar hook protein FlgE [Sphingomonas sp. BIUV-7]MDO6416552.1 flagellar hook protein FlgE [Sphingomonas sp. BIUV-7]